MGVCFAIRSHDPSLRDSTISDVIAKFEPPFGQVWRRHDWHDLSLIYACGASMPVEVMADDDRFSFRMGYSHQLDVAQPESLSVLHKECGVDPERLVGRDGYYVAGIAERGGRTCLGTDALGLFPLYVHSTRDIQLFATTPGLVKAGMRQAPALSPQGFAGILLLGFQCTPESLWEGIQRPPVRHLASLDYAAGPRFTDTAHSRSVLIEDMGEAVERLHTALTHSAKRCAVLGGASGLAFSLSGGLDSRVVAGSLAEAKVSNIEAMTLGDRFDYEARAARLVAKSLDWPFKMLAPSDSQLYEDALRQIDLECASTPLQSSIWWEMARQSARTGRWLMSGLLGDATIGGALSGLGLKPGESHSTFDGAVGALRRSGLPFDSACKALNGLGGREVAEEVMGKLRALWLAQPDRDECRSMHFGLALRGRWNGGVAAWVYACGGGTHVPLATLGVLETMRGIHPRLTLNRALEQRLVIEKYPELARLPIDRNTLDDSPLIPSWRSRFRDLVRPWRLRVLEQRLGWERRIYHRIMNPNCPLWRRLRWKADQSVSGLIDSAVLKSFLPDATAPFPLPADPFAGVMGQRAVVQLLINLDEGQA